jgi:hypothetical protein
MGSGGSSSSGGSGGSGRGSRRGGGRRRPRGGRPGGQGPHGRKAPAGITHGPRKGKAFSTPYEVPETGAVAPFDLFCACLLGLMPDGTYRGAGLGEIAKRFRRSPNELRDLLQRHGMDPETLQQVDFDLTLAKLDIQVAPEGIDRRELARGLFEEFAAGHPRPEVLEGPESEAAGAPRGNGAGAEAARGGHGPAHAHRRSAPTPAAAPEAAEEEEEGEGAPEEAAEPSLVTADVGGPAEPPAGAEEGTPHGGRPVRQIRRSPVRRGR